MLYQITIWDDRTVRAAHLNGQDLAVVQAWVVVGIVVEDVAVHAVLCVLVVCSLSIGFGDEPTAFAVAAVVLLLRCREITVRL